MQADHSAAHTSENAAKALGAYSHARRAGDLLFLAGIGPRTRSSDVIPGSQVDAAGTLISYSIEAEMRSAFANVRTILEEAGSSWDNIVDVTVFLTNLRNDWAVYNRVYAEYFPPTHPQPARTTCEVSALPQGGRTPIHFEVKIIATMTRP
jgi:2-aminomuconate deaminase